LITFPKKSFENFTNDRGSLKLELAVEFAKSHEAACEILRKLDGSLETEKCRIGDNLHMFSTHYEIVYTSRHVSKASMNTQTVILTVIREVSDFVQSGSPFVEGE